MGFLHKNQLAIIYLERNGLTFYSQKGTAIPFTYPQGSVRELDVIEEENLTKELIDFIQKNKLTPATTMIVLAENILYEKEFIDEIQNKKPDTSKVPVTSKVAEQKASGEPAIAPSVLLEERVRKIQLFIDTVPIEDVASKNYKIERGVKIIVTNKKLYETVLGVFTKNLFLVDAVVPMTMIGKDIVAANGMNQEIAKNIFHKLESIKQQSLLEENTSDYGKNDHNNHYIQMTTKVTTKREYALIGIFASLLLILGFVSYVTIFPSTKNKKVASSAKKVLPTISIKPTIIPTVAPNASQSATVQKDLIKIEIHGGTQLQASLLKQELDSSGFTNIKTISSQTPATGKSLVVFSTSLSQASQEAIFEVIKRNLLGVSVQQSDIIPDVIINL